MACGEVGFRNIRQVLHLDGPWFVLYVECGVVSDRREGKWNGDTASHFKNRWEIFYHKSLTSHTTALIGLTYSLVTFLLIFVQISNIYRI